MCYCCASTAIIAQNLCWTSNEDGDGNDVSWIMWCAESDYLKKKNIWKKNHKFQNVNNFKPWNLFFTEIWHQVVTLCSLQNPRTMFFVPAWPGKCTKPETFAFTLLLGLIALDWSLRAPQQIIAPARTASTANVVLKCSRGAAPKMSSSSKVWH